MAKAKGFDFREITKHPRELRRYMTEPERILWFEIRNRKLSGYKFLR